MTNGWYPKAIIKNIPPGQNDPAITPRLAILHVDAGNSESLFDYFNGPSGGVESHFFVKKTGEVEQYRSIYFQADANLDANNFAVSIETQGFGTGEWNDAQLASIKALLTWLHTEAKIPLEECTAWDGSGVGFHVMFGAPGHWTPSAKTCPGPDRIAQFYDVLVPWMAKARSPLRFLPVKHRLVSVNLWVKNKAPLAGLNRIVARTKAFFRFPPDVIACQESGPHLAELRKLEGYQMFVAASEGEAGRELAVLLRDGLKCLGVEYHHAADGVKGGDPVFDHPRGIFIVKYTKRGRKVAVVNTHMGVFGEDKAVAGQVGPAADQHAAHALKVARTVERLRRNGYVAFVTADANSRGAWAEALPAVLVAAGLKGVRRGVDLVTFDLKQVRDLAAKTISRTETGSDTHDAVAIRVTQRRSQ